MQAKAAREVAVLRNCLAAIDNAQAAPLDEGQDTYRARAFGDPEVEVARLELDEVGVRAILQRELQERLSAADQFEQLGRVAHAATLRDEARVVSRYL